MSLFVEDEDPLFHFDLVEGAATTVDDADLLRWATRIGGHCMGVELAESYGRRIAVPSEPLVRVTADKIVARRNIADRGRGPARTMDYD